MKYLYGTYRNTYFNHWEGGYEPSVVQGQQFDDFEGMTHIYDTEIPEERYTYYNANGKKNKTKFLRYSYIDGVNKDELKENIRQVSAQCNITMFESVEDAKAWIRKRTDLVEESEWVFVIQEAREWIEGEIEKQVLEIV